ncbi:TolC family protein [Xylophilus sp.]|uniref:TolC family protein n=1 Tax=Xylophilus sp. TaxID=2653893 RepID=UPI0013BD3C90|nr:TolC family protein [Xylophilus sp.]KAF1048565.1 MAG: hypothetical protein GAK38_01316 [Xylophilus sp.]
MRLLLPVCAAVLALTGCAGFSDDGGLGAPRRTVAERSGLELPAARSAADRDAIDQRSAELLAAPLTADGAAQLALLRHRGLQAGFAALGVAEAQRVQALRLPGPTVGLSRSRQGDETEVGFSLGINLAWLLTLPQARAVEDRRFAEAQQALARDALGVAAAARRAWVDAVAADERSAQSRRARDAASAGAELARRMAAVGNINRLDQTREQALDAHAVQAQARAEREARAARERLLRAIGLWGDEAARLQLPTRLPDPPAAPREQAGVEQAAVAQRLDLQAQRLAVERQARALGLARTTRFIDVLQLEGERVNSNREADARGFGLRFTLPLFAGAARARGAEAQWQQTLHQAAQAAIVARSEVRDAYDGYRTSHAVALHAQQEIVPLARRVADENLLRYNGMLASPFTLLSDARALAAAVDETIAAHRDFWLADAALDAALSGFR